MSDPDPRDRQGRQPAPPVTLQLLQLTPQPGVYLLFRVGSGVGRGTSSAGMRDLPVGSCPWYLARTKRWQRGRSSLVTEQVKLRSLKAGSVWGVGFAGRSPGPWSLLKGSGASPFPSSFLSPSPFSFPFPSPFPFLFPLLLLLLLLSLPLSYFPSPFPLLLSLPLFFPLSFFPFPCLCCNY